MKEPYTGMLPLVSGEIAEGYHTVLCSQRTNTNRVALGVLVDRDLSILCAGGYLIQLLPGASDAEISLLEENLTHMESVTAMLSQKTSLEEMMNRALCGFEPEVLEGSSVCYACNCSRERWNARWYLWAERSFSAWPLKSPWQRYRASFAAGNTA